MIDSARQAQLREIVERTDGHLLVRYPPFPEVSASNGEPLGDLAEVEALLGLARQVVKETLG